MVDIESIPGTVPETVQIVLRIMAIATDAGIMDMTMFTVVSSVEIKVVVVYNGGQMFGKKKKLRKDLPAIDISRKPVKGWFGKTKLIPTSKREQREIKKKLMKRFPERYYVDDLNEWNSISPKEIELAWIDEVEAIDALFFD